MLYTERRRLPLWMRWRHHLMDWYTHCSWHAVPRLKVRNYACAQRSIPMWPLVCAVSSIHVWTAVFGARGNPLPFALKSAQTFPMNSFHNLVKSLYIILLNISISVSLTRPLIMSALTMSHSQDQPIISDSAIVCIESLIRYAVLTSNTLGRPLLDKVTSDSPLLPSKLLNFSTWNGRKCTLNTLKQR